MFITYNEKDYEIEITKKRNKNLYIKVDSNLKIRVVAPLFYTSGMIKRVIKENENTIIKMLEKQLKKNESRNNNCNTYLGKKLNIVYKDVKNYIFNNDMLVVKDDDMLNKWYFKMAKDIFLKRLDFIYSLFSEKIPYPKLKIRSMKSRWGVCNRRDNSITLNLELIKKDIKYIDYVIVHELSHFVYFDHSKSFWMTVSKYEPNYKEIRKEMKLW